MKGVFFFFRGLSISGQDGGAALSSDLSSGSKNISLERFLVSLLHFAVNAVHDSVKNVLDSNARLVGRCGAVLVDASLDENGVPIVISLLVDGVGATDVTLRSVTDKVDSLGGSDEAVLSVAPLAHETRSKLKGRNLGFAKGVGVELALAGSEVLEGDLEHAAESTHTKTDVLVSGRPDNIVVREVEWRTLVEGLRAGAEDTALGHGNVKHDLNVASPIARVGKDEDSVNGYVVEVALTTVGMLFRSELAEGSGGRVVLDDVAGCDDILEAVTLSNETALFTLTADNKDGAVLLSHFPHGGVAANKLARLDVLLELLGEVATALLFGLATTVGKEDVRSRRKDS